MVNQSKHILIAAGGTGGHVYPALAVADYLRAQGNNVTWVGTARGIESRVIPAANIPLKIISVSGLRGKGIVSWIFAPVKLFLALFQAIRILQQTKPDAVLGMGGFVSGPCGLAAFILRKPLYLHEQNAIPGLTNRILKLFATGVMQAFPDSFKNKKNVVTTGNPVRKEISELQSPEIRMAKRDQEIRLLIIGGSLGAQALNENIPLALAALDNNQVINVWHQTGKNKLEATIKSYKAVGIEAKITEFIEDMAEAFSWADLVICRAGALTISELANAGLGAILVPYPFAVDDHQTANANYLVKSGAAILIKQDQLTIKLKDTLLELFSQGRSKLIEMAVAARELSKPEATQRVAEICLGNKTGVKHA